MHFRRMRKLKSKRVKLWKELQTTRKLWEAKACTLEHVTVRTNVEYGLREMTIYIEAERIAKLAMEKAAREYNEFILGPGKDLGKIPPHIQREEEK